MQVRVGAILLLVSALALSGCARWRSRSHLDYRTIQADPNHDSELARVENQRAITLLEKGKIDKAEQSLQQALIADVTYGPAHNNLGKLYFSQGKYYLAAWEFEYAVKLMPHRAECQNNLGLVYEAVGKLDEAIDAYTLAYGMDGKNPFIIGNLARAHVRRGDTDRIVEQLLNDLRLYDTRPPWLHWANERLALRTPTASNSAELTNDSENLQGKQSQNKEHEYISVPQPEPLEESMPPPTFPTDED